MNDRPKTIEESAQLILTKIKNGDKILSYSMNELEQETSVMKLALIIGDLIGLGVNQKVLTGLCVGILIDIDSERNNH